MATTRTCMGLNNVLSIGRIRYEEMAAKMGVKWLLIYPPSSPLGKRIGALYRTVLNGTRRELLCIMH